MSSTPSNLFPPLFPPNPSFTSVLPNTAEGRPIPLDHSTAQHRTTALRKLNRSQPSTRPRLASTAGPPNITGTTTKTCSQPVLVRTYSGPPPSSHAGSRPPTRSRPPPAAAAQGTTLSVWQSARNGLVRNMTRQGGKKPSPQDDPKLPPVQAFSFKSIMAEIQHDIGPDLDRIAEICARSRYSLSNQYEVHVAPHGSGAAFVNSATQPSGQHMPTGPTLQAISSDDEHHTTARQRRKGVRARRRSAAYGTLETIVSSSRSSDEGKGKKKKSAAEIAAEVRGRVAQSSQNESGRENSTDAPARDEPQDAPRKTPSPFRRPFAVAVFDGARNHAQAGKLHHGTDTNLVSQPARPETTPSHLVSRTLPGVATVEEYSRERPYQSPGTLVSESVAAAIFVNPEAQKTSPGLLAELRSWIPWTASAGGVVATSSSEAANDDSYAEGLLRGLLKVTQSGDG
ncbi:hypothetical protein F4780DRAFT_702114 [Xylariomycetidae sp. FL0641]|nr:hypothetical protein F4780DRAFT_702114 [Xylariomycetidae sp. FL0641]